MPSGLEANGYLLEIEQPTVAEYVKVNRLLVCIELWCQVIVEVFKELANVECENGWLVHRTRILHSDLALSSGADVIHLGHPLLEFYQPAGFCEVQQWRRLRKIEPKSGFDPRQPHQTVNQRLTSTPTPLDTAHCVAGR